MYYRSGEIFKLRSGAKDTRGHLSRKEEECLKTYFCFSLVRNYNTLGNPLYEQSHNRLISSRIAESCGFLVPKFICGNCESVTIEKGFFIKALYNTVYFSKNDIRYKSAYVRSEGDRFVQL